MARIKILNRFLIRRFFSGVGLVMLIVCGIIFAVTFVERLPSNPTAVAALNDAWLRLLEYVPMFLPLAIFMGTLLASYNLTKSSEGIIVSGAGLSPYKSARPFLIGAALIGMFATMVINPYAVSQNVKDISSEHLKLVDNTIWLREATDTGYITLNANGIYKNLDNLVFQNATIYIQNAKFQLIARVQSDTVTLSDNKLSADKATVWNADASMQTRDWMFDTRMTPQTVLDRYLQPDKISFWRLPAFIKKMTAIGVPMRGHYVQFWTLLFLPLTMIAMATLGVAFSQTRQRRNFNFGLKFGLGIITCFAIYFLVNMFNALGATGALPPLLSIIAPPLIIIAAAGAFIASFDTI